ncbi:GDSL lipase/esterase protein [Dioscorea alata]|uniref:GDSL lipase/esterase protein n=1 Tax=Dioscorea alata TaxID=55571 RepID=A0ACB7VNN2_DIOAL|nr:GDSL lipase/esterase protein [Dioscorea alata]
MDSCRCCDYVMKMMYLLLCLILLHGHAKASSPAMYVFGDSLADVGNNNHITFSLLKANFPHNGIDYPGHKATGRFSNGNNSVDFLADYLGLPSPPPYLSIKSNANKTQAFLNGLNFASGGAGVFDSTNQDHCLSFNQQINYYSSVFTTLAQQLGSTEAENHLSKSIFTFVIGSNDIFAYDPDKTKLTTQQYAQSMVSTLQGQLKTLYNLGARKFLFVGTGPIGCCPSQRAKSKTNECNAVTDNLSTQYNKGTSSLLNQLKSSLTGFSYSFFDTFSSLMQCIQNPASYGFTEIKAACCGLGNMNAKLACIPLSSYCSDRKKYMFWDPYHPTEIAAALLASTAVNGAPPLVFPINAMQLSAI